MHFTSTWRAELVRVLLRNGTLSNYTVWYQFWDRFHPEKIEENHYPRIILRVYWRRNGSSHRATFKRLASHHRRGLFMLYREERHFRDICGSHNLCLLTLLEMVPIICTDHTYGWTCRIAIMKSRCEFNSFVLNFNNDTYRIRVFFICYYSYTLLHNS